MGYGMKFQKRRARIINRRKGREKKLRMSKK